MTYESITSMNMSEGFHTIFVYVNNVTDGLFVNLLLFSLYIIIAFGSYFIQKKQTGSGDFPVSVAVAGFVTAVTAILLRMIEGLVPETSLIVTIVIAIVGILWLFFSKDS